MSPLSELDTCPVCSLPTQQTILRNRDAYTVKCLNCGHFSLTPEAEDELRAGTFALEPGHAKLAHAIRRLVPGVVITSHLLIGMAQTATLPAARQRVDNLVMHLAETFEPGHVMDLLYTTLRAVIGADSVDGARWAVREAYSMGLVQSLHPEPDVMHSFLNAFLTTAGWDRHEELLKSGVSSRHAFMAMKFGDAQLQAFFR